MKACRIRHPAEFVKVAVLMGGTAAEREISLRSGQAVYQALREQGVDAIAIDVTASPLEALREQSVDRVFNAIHGRGGEDGVLQGLLQVLGLPVTGSGVLASALSMDKLRTKLCWQGQGLPTPRWMLLQQPEDIDRCVVALGFPVIVKPAQEGSSIGMSKAHTREELLAAWHNAQPYGCDIYAEQWVSGQEFTVAILDGEALPAIRLETPHAFYDFEAKYRANTTLYHCPCGLSETREQQLQALALTACDCLGVRGWARVDVFIDNADQAQLIEVNTVPGMTDHSLVPMAAQAAGLSFAQLVWRILETSVAE